MTNKESHQLICNTTLQVKGIVEYGETYREHFLEQYKIAIQGIDYTSKWKHIVNNYFLTIHTVLLAGIGLSATREQLAVPSLTHQVVPIIGLFIAFAWWFTTRNYNEILEAKFSILHCIEDHLPMAIYKTEWEILKTSGGNTNRSALIESIVPIIFSIFYILIFVFVK